MRRGLSLLEVVVSFAVLLTVSVFIFQLVPSSVLAIRQGEIRLEANNLARTLLEENRSKGFSVLQGKVGQVLYAHEHLSGTGVTFKSEVLVRPADTADTKRCLDLAVAVRWQFRDTHYDVRTGAYVWSSQP